MSKRPQRSPPPQRSLSGRTTSHSSLFQWTKFPKEKIVALEIQGDPDMAKTRFCAQALMEVDAQGKCVHHSAVGDTELKAQIEMEKMDPPNTYWKELETMQDFRDFVDHCISDDSIRVVCTDSGSDIRGYAETEFLEETGQKRVYPLVLYGRVFSKIDKQIKKLHAAKKHFVCTCRLKDEFKDDERTGHKIRDSYKRFPYQLPMMIRLQYGIEDESGKLWFKKHMFAKVIKNNWWKLYKEKADDKISKPFLFDISFQGVLDELVHNPWDEKNIVWSAHHWLHKQNLSHNESGTDKLKP